MKKSFFAASCSRFPQDVLLTKENYSPALGSCLEKVVRKRKENDEIRNKKLRRKPLF